MLSVNRCIHCCVTLIPFRQNEVSNTAYYEYKTNECLNNRYFIQSSIGKVFFVVFIDYRVPLEKLYLHGIKN